MTKDDTLALWILAGGAIGAAAGWWFSVALGSLLIGIAAGAGLGIVAGVAIHAVRNGE